jgi:hypothetical protein
VLTNDGCSELMRVKYGMFSMDVMAYIGCTSKEQKLHDVRDIMFTQHLNV